MSILGIIVAELQRIIMIVLQHIIIDGVRHHHAAGQCIVPMFLTEPLRIEHVIKRQILPIEIRRKRLDLILTPLESLRSDRTSKPRSEARRVGKEGVSKCKYGWSP